MTDRIIRRGNLVLTLEETSNLHLLKMMVENIARHSNDDPTILRDFEDSYPYLSGWEFTVISCYKQYVSSSCILGFGLVCLRPFPDESDGDYLDRIMYADDSDLAKMLLLAVREPDINGVTTCLQEEVTLLMKSRVTHLRQLT